MVRSREDGRRIAEALREAIDPDILDIVVQLELENAYVFHMNINGSDEDAKHLRGALEYYSTPLESHALQTKYGY